MDKRSGIYSDRPDMYMLQLIGNGNRFLSMVSYNTPLVTDMSTC